MEQKEHDLKPVRDRKLRSREALALTGKQWYVVQTYAGFEDSVKKNLEEQIKVKNLTDKFGKILIPTEEVVEMRDGQKRRSERKFFPGYILVEVELDDEIWHLIRGLARVIGFVGGSKERPMPLSSKDTQTILEQMEVSGDKPKPKVLFEVGEVVRIIDGPFSDFNGIVEDINYERNRLRVAVLVFGRSTPVELSFGQVEKS